MTAPDEWIKTSDLFTTQRQIAQGIKFGQKPPSLRKSEGDEGSSDEEEVPRSPLQVLAQVEAEPPKMEPKVTAERDFHCEDYSLGGSRL